jgi:S1-C subfamily serine protease
MKRNHLGAAAAAAFLTLLASGYASAAPTDDERPAPQQPATRGAMLGLNIGTAEQQDRAEGVAVISVRTGGPAEAAGLRAGDVIVAVDGKALRRSDAGPPGRVLVEHMRQVQPGQVVRVEALRDGRRQTFNVTAAAAEPPLARLLRGVPMLDGVQLPPQVEELLGGPARGLRGLQLVPITPKLGQYFGTDRGLLVVRAPQVADAALEEGDVVLTIGGRTPDDPRHALRILGSYQPGEKVQVDILRQRKRMTLELQLPAGDDDIPRAGSAPRAPAPPPPPPPPPPAQPTGAATISS